MCGCEATFVCSRCTGTPHDWRYWLDEPLTEAEEADKRINAWNDTVVLPALKARG